MRIGLTAVSLALCVLAGCRSGSDANDAMPGDGEQLSLEDAAREAGLVAEDKTLNPVGSYALQHENGLHQICIGTSRVGGQKFGIVADLGEGLLCQGKGKISLEGDRLTLAFAGSSKCRIEARYDGQSIRLPGKVATECASLCSARATFAGMIVRRTGWSAEDAKAVKARIDKSGTKSGQLLCS